MAKKSILIGSGIIFLFLIWVYFIINHARAYKEKDRTSIGMGETVETPYGECTISEARLYDLPAFVAAHPEISWLGGAYGLWFSEYTDGNDIRILVYRVDVNFKDDESIDMSDRYPRTIVTRDKMYYSACEIMLISLLNEETYISADGKLSVYVPFLLSEEAMTEDEWVNMINKDCGIDVLVQSNPIEKKIMLDDTEYIMATEEEKKYIAELNAKEQSLEEASENSTQDLMKQNVFDDGTGEFGNMKITVNSVKEVDLACIDQDYDSSKMFFDVGHYPMNPPGEYKTVEMVFEVKLTITNMSDGEYRYCMGQTSLRAIKDEEFIVGTEIGYMSIWDYDGKNANSILLKPDETRDMVLLYDFVSVFEADGNGEYINEQRDTQAWYNDDVYLEFANNSFFHTKMDKACVYIKCKMEK